MILKRKDDEAVSPVIGVILMVAITVILAAVIAAFVFGMTGTLYKNRVVSATVIQLETNRIVITYLGGQDDSTLSFVQINAPNGTVWNTTTPTGALAQSTGVKPMIGASSVISGAAGDFSGTDHIVAVGVFTDGVSQVIVDTYV